MAEIILSRGFVVTVDDHMLSHVMKYRWHVAKSGGIQYVRRRYLDGGKLRVQYLHRYIMDVTDKNILVDHRFGNTMDNRIENLRICTHAQNIRNSIGYGKEGFKGVSLTRNKKRWRARIYNGKEHVIGIFDCPIEAAHAYDARAKEVFGEFANTNF